MLLRNYGEDVQHTVEDLRRKFSETYVLAEIQKVPRVVFINSMEETTNGTFCTIGGSMWIHEKEKHANFGVVHADFNLISEYPKELGARSTKTGIYYLSIRPDRQWKCGLCDANAYIQDSRLRYLRFSHELWPAILAAFKPSYLPDLGAALEELKKNKERTAIALNPLYWLRKQDKEVVLFRNRVPLGAFNQRKFFINRACTDFSQELWDDLHIKV